MKQGIYPLSTSLKALNLRRKNVSGGEKCLNALLGYFGEDATLNDVVSTPTSELYKIKGLGDVNYHYLVGLIHSFGYMFVNEEKDLTENKIVRLPMYAAIMDDNLTKYGFDFETKVKCNLARGLAKKFSVYGKNFTYEDLLSLEINEILKFKGIGIKYLNSVIDSLHSMGYVFKDEPCYDIIIQKFKLLDAKNKLEILKEKQSQNSKLVKTKNNAK